MTDFIKNLIKKFSGGYLTNSGVKAGISETREISIPDSREIISKKPAADSLACPYCGSAKFVRRGLRAKKHENVQLYLCKTCGKTFTPQITKGKHYPLAVMLDALSLYNLGYSLEEACRIVNRRQQSRQYASFGSWSTSMQPKSATAGLGFTSEFSGAENSGESKKAPVSEGSFASAEVPEELPALSIGSKTSITDTFGLSSQLGSRGRDLHPYLPIDRKDSPLHDLPRHVAAPSSSILTHINLQPSTLAAWISEFKGNLPYLRLREFALKRYLPKDMVATATLAHRQLYRYRFHRAKCDLMIQEDIQHRKFRPMQDFLDLVPSETPHQYFSEGERASETPLTFSKTAMIVRGKTNFATKTAAFVLQSVKDRKLRHEALQKFMLYNDSVTVATEVPVYIMRDDIEHMKTQLGFQIFSKENSQAKNSNFQNPNSNEIPINQFSNIENLDIENSLKIENCELKINQLPKLITGHIDILQIRNGMIHILDYKPKAEKERPIEQLTLYAMALSRLTGLRLFEFKCAWFDEKDYFEFYPLHVLHKPRRAQRRRKVNTKEGTYLVNRDEKKIEKIRPEAI